MKLYRRTRKSPTITKKDFVEGGLIRDTAQEYWGSNAPTVVAGDTPGTVRQKFGDTLGPEFAAVMGLWEGIADRPELAVDVVRQENVPVDVSTNARTAIQAAVTNHAATKPLFFPKGRYRVGSNGQSGANRVTLTSGTHITADNGAVIEVNAKDDQSWTSTIYGAGTEGDKADLTVDAPAGAKTITLPTGRGADFTVGDMIGIEGKGNPGDYVDAPWYCREFHEITKVTGDVVTLDAPLEYGYLLAEDSQFWKIFPIEDIVIDGLTFEPGPNVTPGVDGSYAIVLHHARNVLIRNVTLKNMIGGIILHDCYNVIVENYVVNSLPRKVDAHGNALIVSGSSARISINNPHISDVRHAFTTLADERSGPTTMWGGPLHIQINNGIGYATPESLSVWDTHEFGRHIHFNNCQAIGGGSLVSGFQMRAQDIALNNCRTHRVGLRGVILTTQSKRVSVNGGDFGHSGSNGIAVGGEDHQITGPRIHDNGGSGIGINDPSCVDLVVDGAVIENNLYGVQDGGASGSVRARIRNCVVPKSATQTIAFLQLSDTAVVEHATCLGYGVDSAGIPYAGVYVPQPGALWSALSDGGRIGNIPEIVGVNAQTGTAYTLTLRDIGRTVTMNNASASTVTIPAFATVPIPVGATIRVIQLGDGPVTIAAPGGVALRNPNGVRIVKPFEEAFLVKVDVNTWEVLVRGNLSATATLDFGSIAANSHADLTMTVAGAVAGDAASMSTPLTSGIVYAWRVSGPDTVTVRAVNVTGSPIDPAADTFKAVIVR